MAATLESLLQHLNFQQIIVHHTCVIILLEETRIESRQAHQELEHKDSHQIQDCMANIVKTNTQFRLEIDLATDHLQTEEEYQI